ncbi:uncharacterized protein LOC125222086 isoform X1 [Salvia hispanica]|uniref:uncharacterized protein LOC125222086 isoform X1 n=1 Tax=Salvia hispanica TaxID=49212 RepID=UPI002009CAAD|nr:uncharacterized protein LOC125222086 isoform X1 [Salvia hispanica]XP_047980474.1 uncharacterized protein LOC125222086 isoform X1 [Salvia hispanica]
MDLIPLCLITFLNEWEIRSFIILSLALQILLTMLGSRRKYVCKLWMRIILWCAYVSADWVAFVALSIIAKSTVDEYQKKTIHDDPGIELRWFWAQFFLLHLGGPDTITAYTLEDNELWLRHVVGMVIPTGLAFYVLLFAFPGSYWLPSLSVLIFVAGVIKCAERLSSLYAAHGENFRNAMLPESDPGPNYPKFMEEVVMKKAEGFNVKVDHHDIDIPVLAKHEFPDEPRLHEVYDLYKIFKPLSADSILSFQDRDRSESYFRRFSWEQAFRVVEIELGFLYDELYTKASVVYNRRGFVCRVITLTLTLFPSLAFIFISKNRKYSTLDLTITHLLLVVAVFLEAYGFWILIDSDWTRQWLTRRDELSRLVRVIKRFQQPIKKRWSKKMAQYNLLDLCVRDKSAVCPRSYRFLPSIRKITLLDHYVEKHQHKYFVDVSDDLMELIFTELRSYTAVSDPAAIWSRKGSFTLEKYTSLSLDWMREREFHERILLWHIATDICSSNDWGDDNRTNTDERKQTADHSKQISEYMMYLLVVYPFMLPQGNGMRRFRDTRAEVRVFLEERDAAISSKVEVCKKLLEVNTEVPPAKVKGDRSKTVLFDACILAKALLAEGKRWEIISKVWMEMLAHAATNCSGDHHVRQLRKGGELLSHVWLLMAHLGITEQFQISQGHARAKMQAN